MWRTRHVCTHMSTPQCIRKFALRFQEQKQPDDGSHAAPPHNLKVHNTSRRATTTTTIIPNLQLDYYQGGPGQYARRGQLPLPTSTTGMVMVMVINSAYTAPLPRYL